MTDKTCSHCGEKLIPGGNWSEGSIRSRTKICRACNSAKGKAWSRENRERARGVAMARRHADPDKMRAARKDYYARNKEKWCGYAKTWRDTNRSIPEKRARIILTFVRTRSKRLGLEFDISHEFLAKKLIAGVCEVTGMPLSLEDADRGKKKVHPFAPSVDRIDPHLGYTESNVRVVTYMYNIAKGDFSDQDVLLLAKAIVANADRKGIP